MKSSSTHGLHLSDLGGDFLRRRPAGTDARHGSERVRRASAGGTSAVALACNVFNFEVLLFWNLPVLPCDFWTGLHGSDASDSWKMKGAQCRLGRR